MKPVLLLVLFACLSCYGQRADFSQIDFKKADSIALALKGESLQNLPVLTHKLTTHLTTDVEKFRAIYTWVSTNIENDYTSYIKTSKKRKKFAKDREALLEWNRSFTPKVFQKLLKEKKTACTGYAYLVQELVLLADINCKIIDGYGRTAHTMVDENSLPNHSWNAVELNGKWYLSDATWSAGRVEVEEGLPRFIPDYADGYFLANPILFAKNHYPLDSKWVLMSESYSFQDFTKGPVVYKEAFKHNITPIAPRAMHIETLRNEAVVFSLNVPPSFKNENISLLLTTGNSNKNMQSKVSSDQNGQHLEHIFTKAGTYDIHIKANDDILATYVVKVKRK
ncbi:MAG: hypothetical protein COA50_12670 [Flavobacteriaceae bacterium]|nr:MAG: hypothetical protein COA50_12670 [Flavobacteriaceae bacterium]